jgi:hypothetical protein
MMRQVWASIATAWAVMAVFVVLALSQRATLPAATGAGVVMARSASGGLVPVATGTGAVHATTSSSVVAPAGGGGGQAVTYVKTAAGNLVPVTSAGSTAPVTRSS